jgi:hypothetical protein
VPPDRGTLRHFLRRCFFEGGSKAVVAHLAGAGRGLESERAYTMRVLPAGVRAGLADAVRGRDPHGLARAAAIVTGLATTGAGYVAGMITLQDAAERRGWAGRRLGGRGRVSRAAA